LITKSSKTIRKVQRDYKKDDVVPVANLQSKVESLDILLQEQGIKLPKKSLQKILRASNWKYAVRDINRSRSSRGKSQISEDIVAQVAVQRIEKISSKYDEIESDWEKIHTKIQQDKEKQTPNSKEIKHKVGENFYSHLKNDLSENGVDVSTKDLKRMFSKGDFSTKLSKYNNTASSKGKQSISKSLIDGFVKKHPNIDYELYTFAGIFQEKEAFDILRRIKKKDAEEAVIRSTNKNKRYKGRLKVELVRKTERVKQEYASLNANAYNIKERSVLARNRTRVHPNKIVRDARKAEKDAVKKEKALFSAMALKAKRAKAAKRKQKKKERKALDIDIIAESKVSENENIEFPSAIDFIKMHGHKLLEKLVEPTCDFMDALFSKNPISFAGTVISFLYQLTRSRSYLDYASSTYLFVQASGLTISKHIKKAVLEFVEDTYHFIITKFDPSLKDINVEIKVDEEIMTESKVTDLNAMYVMLIRVLDSAIVQSFKKLILTVASFKFFSRDVSSKLFKMFGKPERMPIINLIYEMFENLLVLLKVGDSVLRGVPISEALLSEDPVAKIMNDFHDLMGFKDLTYVGLPVDGHMCRYEFVNKLEILLKAARSLRDTVTTQNPKYRPLTNVITSLVSVKSEFLQLVSSTRRCAPIGVILHGKPGVGKSKILPYIATIHCKLKGRKFHDGLIYERDKVSEYWEGYAPLSQPIIHYSEIGNISKNAAKMRGDPVINEFCSLVDSNPMSCNMAFGEKGKVYALPELVLLDTNSPDLNLDALVQNQAAVKRRFLYIETFVKEEFLKNDGTCGICPKKSILDLENGGDLMDRWLFNVVTYAPKDKKRSLVKYHLREGDIYKLTQVLSELFKTHINLEEQMRDLTVKGDIFDDTYNASILNKELDQKEEDLIVEMRILNRNNYDVIAATSKAYAHRVKEVAKEKYSNLKHNVSLIGHHSTNILYYGWMNLFSMLILMTFRANKDAFTNPFKFNRNILCACLCFSFLFTKNFYYIFLICLISFINPKYVYMIIVNYFVSKDFYANKFNHHIRLLRNAVGIININPWHDEFTFGVLHVAALGAVGTIIYTLYSLLKPKKKQAAKSESNFKIHSEYNDKLKDYEDNFSCGQSYERIPNKLNTELWNVREIYYPHAAYTGNPETLMKVINRNIRRVIVESKGKRIDTYIFGVQGNTAVINTHSLLGSKEDIVIKICSIGLLDNRQAVTIDTCLAASDILELGNDVTLIKLDAINFKDITPHLVSGKYPNSFAGFITDQKTRFFLQESPIKVLNPVTGNISLNPTFSYTWKSHSVGKCGLPIVGSATKGSVIYGIHAAGQKETCLSYGVFLDKDTINAGLKTLNLRESGFVQHSEGHIFGEVLHSPLVKSMTRYEVLHGIQYFGRRNAPVFSRGKSKLRPTPFSEDMEELLTSSLKFDNLSIYGPPPMKHFLYEGEYINPFNIALKGLASQKKALNHTVLKKCEDIFVDRICTLLSKDNLSLKPLDLHTAVNGADIDPFIRRMNANTSAGFGYLGKKSNIMPIVEEKEGFVLREPIETLKREVCEALDAYARGEMVHPMTKAALKDEARLMEKNIKGKTRVFYVSTTCSIILARMFLSPFYTLMLQHNNIFGTAVGINMHSGVTEFINYMFSKHKNIMQGDYGKYDRSMPFGVSKTAGNVVFRVLKKLGYNDKALQIVSGLLTDNLFTLLVVMEDVFICPGLQPSGKYATAEDNSIRGIILLMYAWYIHPSLCDKNFFDEVTPQTYGDDLFVTVSKGCAQHFHCLYYAHVCKETYGMNLTSVTKGEITEKFVSKADSSFLKRKFVYKAQYSKWVAPLEKDSILKSLMWYIPSKSVEEEKQWVDTARSCLWESFFHLNSKKFEKLRKKFITIYAHNTTYSPTDLADMFPMYGELEVHMGFVAPVEPLNNTKGKRKCSLVSLEYEDIMLECRVFEPVEAFKTKTTLYDIRDCVYFNIISTLHANIEEKKKGGRVEDRLIILRRNLLQQLSVCETELKDKDVDIHSHPASLRRDIKGKRPKFRKTMQYNLDLLIQHRALQSSLDSIHRIMNKRKFNRNIYSESNVLDSQPDLVDPGVIEEKENLLDIGGMEEDVTSISTTRPIPVGLEDITDLGDFLSRPLQIATFTVTNGGSVTNSYDIWSLMLAEPSVRAKLRNFAYFRADMGVRIAVSGMPFHYGKILVSYIPYPDKSEHLIQQETALALDAAWRPIFLNFMSQTRGAITIDVKENKPVDMFIPHISPKAMHRNFNNSALVLGSSTNFADTEKCGTLYLTSVNPIDSTTAGSSDVSVYIYAWFENVQLGTNTATQMEIVSESRIIKIERKDEREKGPMETFASNSAKVSRMMGTFPSIRFYALASEIVFTGLRRMSALFGWSRPAMNTPPSYVKNQPYTNGTQTIGYGTGKRITLDPKQELTVDMSFVGPCEDELVIAAIASKEAYLDTFEWAESDDIMSTPLWSSVVTPRLETWYTDLFNTYYQPTPMSFAATPFYYWRGKVIFRVEFICNAFHRGKIAVVFEPNLHQSILIDADISTNKQFIRIVDIQETQCVEFCVNWASPFSWLKVPTVIPTVAYGAGYFEPESYDQAANGYISIAPVTALQSPDGLPIQVNVYVRMEDAEFNQFTDARMPLTRGVVTESRDISGSEIQTFDLNPSSEICDNCALDYFGERPLSFRALLKRFVRTAQQTIPVDITGPVKTLAVKFPILPSIHPTFDTGTASYTNLYSYLRYAFLAMRGGMTKRIRVFSDLTFSPYSTAKVGLRGPTGSDPSESIAFESGPRSAAATGTVTFVPHTNGGIEFELPYYNMNLFSFSCADNQVGSLAAGEMNTSYTKGYSFYADCLGDNTEGYVVEESSTGEDFSFSYYLGAPFYSVAV
jgi:hypothetical protein